jgi:ABC-type nitrate/sulfonate/bicarbonate transport system substrate-binding protein
MMRDRDNGRRGRRKFLTGAAALGATAFACIPRLVLAEPAPEVKKIRLIHALPICLAPGYLAEELLHAEGFDEVEYVDITANLSTPYVASGRVDMWVEAAPALVNVLDSNDSVLALGGIHSGCYELFGRAEVRTIRDLKGRSVSISVYGATEHVFVSSMAAYVGMDPRKDINWLVGGSSEDAMRAFSEGKADAFLAFAPEPQELRVRKIGHVHKSRVLMYEREMERVHSRYPEDREAALFYALVLQATANPNDKTYASQLPPLAGGESLPPLLSRGGVGLQAGGGVACLGDSAS